MFSWAETLNCFNFRLALIQVFKKCDSSAHHCFGTKQGLWLGKYEDRTWNTVGDLTLNRTKMRATFLYCKGQWFFAWNAHKKQSQKGPKKDEANRYQTYAKSVGGKLTETPLSIVSFFRVHRSGTALYCPFTDTKTIVRYFFSKQFKVCTQPSTPWIYWWYQHCLDHDKSASNSALSEFSDYKLTSKTCHRKWGLFTFQLYNW